MIVGSQSYFLVYYFIIYIFYIDEGIYIYNIVDKS